MVFDRQKSVPDMRPQLMERREFIKKAAVGTAVVALGGVLYRIAGDDLTRRARAQTRTDGRKRLPPGQRVLEKLKPMGGEPGSPRTKDFRLTVHGEVEKPLELDYEALLKLPNSSGLMQRITGAMPVGKRIVAKTNYAI